MYLVTTKKRFPLTSVYIVALKVCWKFCFHLKLNGLNSLKYEYKENGQNFSMFGLTKIQHIRNWKERKHGKYEVNAKLDQHQPMMQPVLQGANLITWNRINDRKISVLLITFLT